MIRQLDISKFEISEDDFYVIAAYLTENSGVLIIIIKSAYHEDCEIWGTVCEIGFGDRIVIPNEIDISDLRWHVWTTYKMPSGVKDFDNRKAIQKGESLIRNIITRKRR